MSKNVNLKFGEILIVTDIFQKMSQYSLSVSTFISIEQLLGKLLPIRKSIEQRRNEILEYYADEILYYHRNSQDSNYEKVSKEEYDSIEFLSDNSEDNKNKIEVKRISNKELEMKASDEFNEFLNSDIQLEIQKPIKETDIEEVKVSWEDFIVLKKFLI